MNNGVTQKPDTYPARFPLKVIGRAGDNFVEHVKAVLDHHTSAWDPQTLRTNPSKDQRYIAVTAMVTVDEKAQIERLYVALKAIPEVVMCL
jgi:putative lipoic acid-binding regulatory protein